VDEEASGNGDARTGPVGERCRVALGAEVLEALSANVLRTLEALQVPAFAIDGDRRIRWQNAAASALVGDLRGKLDSTYIAPEDLARVREAFARKLLGALHTEYEVTIIRADGRRVRLGVSSVPLRAHGRVVGTFALGRAVEEAIPRAEGPPALTARQHQTLTLLSAGSSTSQMAELMGLSEETVRNHVKRLLRRLNARSRVEAVAKGRRASLI